MSRYSEKVLIGLLIFWILQVPCAYSLPAFPGAEGYGSDTIGGRGGTVVKVTNLNDSGPGSFRAAVTVPPRNYATGVYQYEPMDEYLSRIEGSGHRIVIFEVSGIIDLETNIIITVPFLTIAGQTSPGGILISGRPTVINAHDVVVQHLRFRTGSHRIIDADDADVQRSLYIVGDGLYYDLPAYNVIIDHCSFSWATDQVFTIGENAKNIIVQYCIVSEGLNNAGHPEGNHSYGLFYWGKGTEADAKYSTHHNYIAHNNGRNPQISLNGFMDFRNNVVFNAYGGQSVSMGAGVSLNAVHNLVKAGNSTSRHDIPFLLYGADDNNCSDQVIFLEGNLGNLRTSQTDPDHWKSAYWVTYLPRMEVGPLSLNCKRSTPFDASFVTTSEMSHDYALELLDTVGATKPVRDSVDERVVADFGAGTGKIRDDVVFPDDFPLFANTAAPEDNDNDGMADRWEQTLSLNTGADDAALDHDGDGYTNIEEYLHYLATDADPTVPQPPSGLVID